MTSRTRPVLIILLAILAALPVSGCVPATIVPLAAALGADVAIFHRTPPDMIYAAGRGRDCSLVRLDSGLPYCREPDPAPPPPVTPPPATPRQPYCTRSLGLIDCWSHPERMIDLPPQVAHAVQPPAEPLPRPPDGKLRLARWNGPAR